MKKLACAIAIMGGGCSGSKSPKASTGTTGTGAAGATGGSTGGSGAGTTTGAPCGAVTTLGGCSGTVLTYCDPASNTLLSQDCAQYVQGEAFACALIDSAYGYDCAAPIGSNCLLTDSQGNSSPALCQGTGPGCVFGTSGILCQAGFTACASLPDAGFVPVCSANVLEIGCDVDQPVAYDCASLGGSCSTPSTGAECGSLPVGMICDDQVLFCATGHSCVDPDGGGQGFCQ